MSALDCRSLVSVPGYKRDTYFKYVTRIIVILYPYPVPEIPEQFNIQYLPPKGSQHYLKRFFNFDLIFFSSSSLTNSTPFSLAISKTES